MKLVRRRTVHRSDHLVGETHFTVLVSEIKSHLSLFFHKSSLHWFSDYICFNAMLGLQTIKSHYWSFYIPPKRNVKTGLSLQQLLFWRIFLLLLNPDISVLAGNEGRERTYKMIHSGWMWARDWDYKLTFSKLWTTRMTAVTQSLFLKQVPDKQKWKPVKIWLLLSFIARLTLTCPNC